MLVKTEQYFTQANNKFACVIFIIFRILLYTLIGLRYFYFP